MPRLPLVALAVLALAVAGCGSSKKSSSSSSSGATSTSGGAAAPSGGGAIDMKNTAFDPKETSVKVGQKITWTNQDSFDHNVTAESGATFKSKNFGKGGTFSFTPTKPGMIKYVCTIHPGMAGTITVK